MLNNIYSLYLFLKKSIRGFISWILFIILLIPVWLGSIIFLLYIWHLIGKKTQKIAISKDNYKDLYQLYLDYKNKHDSKPISKIVSWDIKKINLLFRLQAYIIKLIYLRIIQDFRNLEATIQKLEGTTQQEELKLVHQNTLWNDRTKAYTYLH